MNMKTEDIILMRKLNQKRTEILQHVEDLIKIYEESTEGSIVEKKAREALKDLNWYSHTIALDSLLVF